MRHLSLVFPDHARSTFLIQLPPGLDGVWITTKSARKHNKRQMTLKELLVTDFFFSTRDPLTKLCTTPHDVKRPILFARLMSALLIFIAFILFGTRNSNAFSWRAREFMFYFVVCVFLILIKAQQSVCEHRRGGFSCALEKYNTQPDFLPFFCAFRPTYIASRDSLPAGQRRPA